MKKIAGHDIHVAKLGVQPKTLMIHCALARHESFLPLVKALDRSAVLFDLPGHGRSGNWDKRAEYQSLVANIIGELCERPMHLIGHSFGATAALRLAVEQLSLVDRLTLIEPVYFAAAKGTAAHQTHAKAFRPFIGAMLEGDENRAAEVFNELWGDVAWADLPVHRQQYLTERIHLIVAGAAAIEKDTDNIVSSERLGKVMQNVTLVRGGNTQSVITEIHAMLANHLPHAQNHVVANAGHMLPWTHTNEVAEIIRAADQETD